MRISIERALLLLILMLSCLCVWRASAVMQADVSKIYHHKAVHNNNVEWGSCVVYGKNLHKKTVVESFRTIDNTEERTFFIPRTRINSHECKQMMHTINSTLPHPKYTLTIQEVTKPDIGIVLTFSYPINSCTIAYKHIDSIQREQGIVFNIYNTSLVQQLKKRNEPIIRTAHVSSPPIIFLDPGHGGEDIGATSRGIAEKDICLAVSLEVEKLLINGGYTVFLSRDNDSCMPLDMRTYKAHMQNADMLVSIHANSSANTDAHGIEIFFLDQEDLCDDGMRKRNKDLTYIQPLLKKRSLLSDKLASEIHDVICNYIPSYNKTFKDRGIKKAVAQVLVGAYTPAVLIEVGFMTHPYELSLLIDKNYQKILASAIADGICNYCVNI